MDGERLSEVRKDRGLTQKQLADLFAVSVHTISSYERGLTTPDDELKIRLAAFFNVSVDYLMGLDTHPEPRQPFSVVFLDDFPPAAKQETQHFIRYLMSKYHLSDDNA